MNPEIGPSTNADHDIRPPMRRHPVNVWPISVSGRQPVTAIRIVALPSRSSNDNTSSHQPTRERRCARWPNPYLHQSLTRATDRPSRTTHPSDISVRTGQLRFLPQNRRREAGVVRRARALAYGSADPAGLHGAAALQRCAARRGATRKIGVLLKRLPRVGLRRGPGPSSAWIQSRPVVLGDNISGVHATGAPARTSKPPPPVSCATDDHAKSKRPGVSTNVWSPPTATPTGGTGRPCSPR